MHSMRTQTDSVYDVILRQHLDFRRMLNQIEEEQDVEMLKELKQYITGHQRAEEITIFKDLMSDSDMKDLTLEMAEEHHVGDVILGELMEMNPGSDTWKAKAKVFKEIVEDHLNEEESEYFPKAQMNRDEQWAKDMVQQFQSVEEQRAGDTEVALPQYA